MTEAQPLTRRGGKRFARWERLSTEFDRFHREPLNVFLHLVTTPLCLLSCLSLLALWTPWAAAVAAGTYAVFALFALPARTAVATAAASGGLLLGALFLPGVVEGGRAFWVTALVAGYVLQEAAHWVTGEEAVRISAIGSQSWAGRLAERALFLLPLVFHAAAKVEGTVLSFLVSRKRVLNAFVEQPDNLAEIDAFVSGQSVPRDKTTRWWQAELEGKTGAAFASLADAADIREMFRSAHGDGAAVEILSDMNEVCVAAPADSLSSGKVFYTAHIDGPWAAFPGATVYRAMLAVNENRAVHTHFPQNGCDEVNDHGDTLADNFTLTTGHVVAFDYNREPHYVTSDRLPEDESLRPPQRTSLKLHYLVYPKKLAPYARLLGRLSTAYNTNARKRFLDTAQPTGMVARAKATGIRLCTRLFEWGVDHAGWSNLLAVLSLAAVSLMAGRPDLLLATTSFIHYLLYLATFADRRDVCFPRFKRNAIFFRTVAITQLAGWLLYFRDLGPLGFGLIAVGFGLACWSAAVLGSDRTYYGWELGHCRPKRIDRAPYGLVPHPMILGAIVGLIGMGLSPGLRDTFPWLVPTHIGFYLLVLIQEVTSQRSSPGEDVGCSEPTEPVVTAETLSSH